MKKQAKASSANLFSGAGKAPDIFKVKKSNKKEREEIDFGDELDELAAIEVLIDSLEGIGKQLKAEMGELAYEAYADRAFEHKKHPSSFVALGEVATASVEMRRRGANMPIVDPEVLKDLNKLKIPLQKNVKIPERYVLNQELIQKEEIRNAISEALSSHPKLKNIVGDLIQLQGEEYTYCTNETTLEIAAQKLTKEQYVQYIPFLSTLAIGKFHLNGEAITEGKKEDKVVTNEAKSLAIKMLQERGILPKK